MMLPSLYRMQAAKNALRKNRDGGILVPLFVQHEPVTYYVCWVPAVAGDLALCHWATRDPK